MDSASRQYEQAAERLSEIAEAERERFADISLIPEERMPTPFSDAIENAGVGKGLSSLADEYQSPQPHSQLQDLDLPASTDVQQRRDMVDGIYSQLDVLEQNRRLSEEIRNFQQKTTDLQQDVAKLQQKKLDVLEENRMLSGEIRDLQQKNNNLQTIANQEQRKTNRILQKQGSVSLITAIITGLWQLSGGVHQIGAVRITALHVALGGLVLIGISALVAYYQNE